MANETENNKNHYPEDKLRRALENPSCYNYTEHKGPLKRDMLDEESVDAEEIDRVTAVFGWPDEVDAMLEPTKDFEPLEFAEMINDARPGSATNLARFMNYFKYSPVPFGEDGRPERKPATQEEPYSANPVLYRAYALMPDLMEALHERVVTIQDVDLQPDETPYSDPELVCGLLIAYEVMGRLVKQDDEQTILRFLYPEHAATSARAGSVNIVKSAHTYLAR